MRCPVDGTELLMTDRQGVEIDYCPTCRGVWLDRGELDKIIERSAVEAAHAAPQRRAAPVQGHARDGGSYREDRGDHRYDPRAASYGGSSYGDSRYQDPKYHKKKKRKSLLDDLFDF